MNARLLALAALGAPLAAQEPTPPVPAPDLAVRGRVVHTMAGAPIENGVVLVRDGKITAVGGPELVVPAGVRTVEADVITPGLIDAHSVVGLAGYLNYAHDQDQIERSAPIQPELRAIDSYNAREPLIEWVRGFGVTTLHTGHGPGSVISGQTLIAKTRGATVDEAALVPAAMVAATIGESAVGDGKGFPGNRSKAVALLRAELIAARAYANKLAAADEDEKPARNLRHEALLTVLNRERPLLVTAQRANDILTAIRIAREFDFELVLDGAAEGYLVLEQIQRSGAAVILHPTMRRATGETENLSLETAKKLIDAKVPLALQSGFESYVPKTRVVLFEAAMAAANGLTFAQALGLITIDAARILKIDDRVGSLEVGKHADFACYDGDPFEYTSHCTTVIIEGEIVSDEPR